MRPIDINVIFFINKKFSSSNHATDYKFSPLPWSAVTSVSFIFHKKYLLQVISPVKRLICPALPISSALTLSRRRSLSYRNQSIDLLCKSMDWFLYDNGLRLERSNNSSINIPLGDFHLPIRLRWDLIFW